MPPSSKLFTVDRLMQRSTRRIASSPFLAASYVGCSYAPWRWRRNSSFLGNLIFYLAGCLLFRSHEQASYALRRAHFVCQILATIRWESNFTIITSHLMLIGLWKTSHSLG